MNNKLVLVRHGQSTWNEQGLFTGWYDAELTDLGKKEAKQTGQKLSKTKFGLVFSSNLWRAYETAQIILQQNIYDTPQITIHKELKERSYGLLTGVDKGYANMIYGEEQIQEWRRSFLIPPKNSGESLKDTYDRVVPFFKEFIEPALDDGNVLVSAHGNSIRALVKFIDNISDKDIETFEVKTGQPLTFKWSKHD